MEGKVCHSDYKHQASSTCSTPIFRVRATVSTDIPVHDSGNPGDIKAAPVLRRLLRPLDAIRIINWLNG